MKQPGSDFPNKHWRQVGPGTRLNGIYEIDHLIARGGMGEIYAGRAIETGIKVAIKMIRSDQVENPTVLALFRREAIALHNLNHDAIVRYYVFTTDPELQVPYLAMEFVEGESLFDLLKGGPMPVAAVRILQRRLAAGFEAAHQSGVTHRDLSPGNVIVPNGSPEKAKLIDFGIARNALGQTTVIGRDFAGKANFASPEQVGLFGGDAGPRSDIYSLGLTLAAALLGQPIDMGGSQLNFVRKRQVVPDLSGIDASMRPLLTAMLQPDPEKRPQSMAEVATWNTEAAAPKPTSKASPSRPRWLVPAGLAGSLAIVATGFLGWHLWPQEAVEPEPTVQTAPSRPVANADPVRTAPPEPARPEPARPEPAPTLPPPRTERPPEPARPEPPPVLTADPPVTAPVTPSRPEPPARTAEPAPERPAPNAPTTVAGQNGAPATTPGAFRDCATCPELVVVAAGSFRMGSSADASERPIHDVTVQTFAAGRLPVTLSEWRLCVAEKGCAFDPGGDPASPVHNLSWTDTQEYIAWISRVTGQRYRLLTEAEWEYAARAGSKTRYWWGDQFRPDLASCRGCADTDPRVPPPSGRFPPNPFGLADVTGSVGQWVEDCWHKDYQGAPRDGSTAWIGPNCRQHVLRGGSWMQDAAALRITSRDVYDTSVRYPGHGFRIGRNM